MARGTLSPGGTSAFAVTRTVRAPERVSYCTRSRPLPLSAGASSVVYAEPSPSQRDGPNDWDRKSAEAKIRSTERREGSAFGAWACSGAVARSAVAASASRDLAVTEYPAGLG